MILAVSASINQGRPLRLIVFIMVLSAISFSPGTGLIVALDGHRGLAEFLIAKGANVNAKCKFGETPLHFAAGGGHQEVVELLVAKGADVSAKDFQRKTPLSWAKDRGHQEIIELLSMHGGKE